MIMRHHFKLMMGIVVILILATIGSYLRLWLLGQMIGPFRLAHWFAIFSSSYILIVTVFFAYGRRFTSLNRFFLLMLHTFGNLLASVLIFMHFAHHLSRPPQAFPQLGTGISSMLLMILILPTGFSLRFGFLPQQRETWRIIHVGVSIALLIVVIIHTLITLDII
jgi:hypothetical protein